ncbi:MAG: multidrug effflux MFS transporter [Eggerthellaceae bacterium]
MISPRNANGCNSGNGARSSSADKSTRAEAPRRRSASLAVPQPRLGVIGLGVLLVLANTLIPLSLDIYTPAVPEMPAHFGTTESMVNLTVAGFFLFLAVGMLAFGPVSDRVGRKPVLVAGMGAYTLGSAICAVSPTIEMLIAARVVQALGAGGALAASTAVVKDSFDEERSMAMLSVIQTVSVLGPIAAPLIGGAILLVADWRTIFWVLAIAGAACLALSMLYRETLSADERPSESLARTFARLGNVLRNRRFDKILVASGMFNVPFMAYIAVGSYTYVDFFGQTQQVYTYFFAATAAVSAFGPLLFMRLKRVINPARLIYVCLALGIAAGAGLVAFCQASLWGFAGMMCLFALLEAMTRPYLTTELLYANPSDTGSASAMLNFGITALGCVGMAVIMAPFPNYVVGIGVIMMASMAIAVPLWFRR